MNFEKNNLKETYNKIAKDWHLEHQSDDWWQKGTNEFISYLKRGDEVLDVGCGGGTKSKYLMSKGLKVVGMDFSEKLIEIAERENPAGKFLVMNINDLDKLEQSFDGIFMQAVLLHIPKKEIGVILEKAVQRLKKDGYLYVAVKEIKEGQENEEIRKDNDYGYEYERFFSYFTLGELKDCFEKIGLEVVNEETMPPSRSVRKTKWIQIIGRKK